MGYIDDINNAIIKSQAIKNQNLVDELRKYRTAYKRTTKRIQNLIAVYDSSQTQNLGTLFRPIEREMRILNSKLTKSAQAMIGRSSRAAIIDTKASLSMLGGGNLKSGAKLGMTADVFQKTWKRATAKIMKGIRGIELSTRIWDLHQTTYREIRRMIATGYADREYVGTIMNNIRGFLYLPEADMRKKYWKEFYKDNPPGRGRYKSAYKNMDRLIRTEVTRAYREATAEYASKKAWVKGLKWHRSAGAGICTSGECPEYETSGLHGLGAGVYPPDAVPISHANCYSKDTRVLTDHGFKYFKDVLKTDKIMSLNVKTGIMEYVEWKEKIEYNYEGEMILFKKRGINLLVTPNHRMLIRKMWKNKLYIKSAEVLFDSLEFRILRTAQWITSKQNNIDIWLARFFGWYIAEGSVVKRGPNWYQLAIAQKNIENRKRIKEILTHLNIKYREDVEQISFNGVFAKDIYDLKLGKSHEKYIPDIIKNTNIDNIKAFLKEFCKGDGNKRVVNCFGYPSESIVYFTSSEKLKNDICELILKSGKSYYSYIHTPKGTVTTFKNGIYTSNHNIYGIRESNCKHIRRKNMDIHKEYYNDYVYCLELYKNSIMYVERKGYGLWCGNCQCYLTIEPREEALIIDNIT